MANQTAKIKWRDGTIPVSTRFDDPYFSLNGGLAEARHVFLSGNDLPTRLSPGFHIAELGFGTGLNMLAAWAAWNNSGQPGAIQFTSFEQFPMALSDMAKSLSSFPALATQTTEFLAHFTPQTRHLTLPGLKLHIIHGDANYTVADWPHRADAWFLDGFSPAKNPELWTAQLLQQVADHTTPNGTFATYTAAGHVRRALADAGFTVKRQPGYGRKRHMTVGKKPDVR